MVIDPGRRLRQPELSPLPGAGRRTSPMRGTAGTRRRCHPARAGGPSARPLSERRRRCRTPAGGRHQQRVGGAAAGERRIPGVADWRRGGARRAPAAGARPAERGRRAQGRASRLRLEHAAGDAGRPAPGGRAHLLRRGQRVRPPACRSRSSTWPRVPGLHVRRTDLEGTLEVVADGARHRRRRPRTAWMRVASARGGTRSRSGPRSCSIHFELPDGIVVHSQGVARVAAEAARLVAAAGVPVDVRLVEVAALLHDIDKLETRQGGGDPRSGRRASAWRRWDSRS